MILILKKDMQNRNKNKTFHELLMENTGVLNSYSRNWQLKGKMNIYPFFPAKPYFMETTLTDEKKFIHAE